MIPKQREFTVKRHPYSVKRIWYLSHMRAAKFQASLRIRAVSPEPSLLVHTSSESRVTFRQKARSLAPLNGWACAVVICHDGMLEDTNSLDGAQLESYLDVQYHMQEYTHEHIKYINPFIKNYKRLSQVNYIGIYKLVKIS